MADNVTVDNGDLTDFEVSADEAASGKVQRVKLTLSADGSDTHVPATSAGLKVDLGSDNDVTVTSGAITATLGAGTAAIGKLAANSGVDIGDVDVTSVAAITPGTGNVNLGKAEDAQHVSGSTGVMVLAVRTDTEASGAADNDYEALHTDNLGALRTSTAIVDSDGARVGFAAPAVLSATPTLDTSAYAANDSMDTTVLSFTSATVGSGGSGHILRMTVVDASDQGVDMKVHFFEASVTPAAENDEHSLSDADAANYIGTISTSDGTWQDHTLNQTCTVTPAPPLPYKVDDGTTLFGVLVSEGAGTYAANAVTIKLHVVKDN